MHVVAQPAHVALGRGGLELADRHVKACEVAFVARQRGHRLEAVAIAQLDRHFGRLEALEQCGDGEAVARMQAQRARHARQGAVQLAFELGGERLQQRRQPRGDAPVGPDQLLGQRRQGRAAPAAASSSR